MLQLYIGTGASLLVIVEVDVVLVLVLVGVVDVIERGRIISASAENVLAYTDVIKLVVLVLSWCSRGSGCASASCVVVCGSCGSASACWCCSNKCNIHT